MADYPYMPLWTDAYLADTRHLSTLEHGAYLLLLMEAWRRPDCSLPDNDVLLAKLAGLDASEWAAIKQTVMALWFYDGRSKNWSQKRLQKEHRKTAQKSSKARKSAASRWKQSKKDNANAMRTQCSSDANHNHIHTHNYITLINGRARELYDAVGITDETKTPAFLSLSEPLNWIEQGCDIDTDIIPTLRAVTIKRGTIPNGWAYYRRAVFEAKAIRERPAEKITIHPQRNAQPTKADRLREMNEFMENG